jgi:hypothetical protein
MNKMEIYAPGTQVIIKATKQEAFIIDTIISPSVSYNVRYFYDNEALILNLREFEFNVKNGEKTKIGFKK